MGVTQVPGKQVLDGSVTDADVAAANKDGLASVPSMRTLGTTAQQAAPGNDSRFAVATYVFEERQNQGVYGSPAVAATWTIRVINTIVTNSDGAASLASNVMTIPAGKYVVRGRFPAAGVDRHQARLFNVTDGVVQTNGSLQALGSTAYGLVSGTSPGQSDSELYTTFTITAAKAFRIEHNVGISQATYGFGVAGNMAQEVYANIEFIRLGDATFVAPPPGTQGLIILKDRKASGTSGGGATASVWTRRALTFKDTDTNADCTLDTTTNIGQFVLAAGTYEIDAVCPVANCLQHQTRLRNITANAGAGLTLVNGSSGYANSGTVADNSFLRGSFTVAVGQTLEIQHIVGATVATVGFGGAATTGEFEVYTQARIRRLS